MDTTSGKNGGRASEKTSSQGRQYRVPEEQKRQLYHIAEVAGGIGLSAGVGIAGIAATSSPASGWAFWPSLIATCALGVLAFLLTILCLLCCTRESRVFVRKLSLRITTLGVKLSSLGVLEASVLSDLINVQRVNLAYIEAPSWRLVTVCLVELWPLNSLLLNHDADIPTVLRALQESLSEARLLISQTTIDESYGFLTNALSSAQTLTTEFIGNAVLLVWECPLNDGGLEAENAFHLLLFDFVAVVQQSFSSKIAILCDYRIGNPALPKIGLRIAFSFGQAWPQLLDQKTRRLHWVGTPVDEVLELVKEHIY